MTSNLFSLLITAAETCPEKAFLLFNGERITYLQVLEASRKFTGFLVSEGLACGDRILLNIGNVPEMVYAVFGALQMGVVPVLVNPAARRHELRSYIEKTGPRIVVTHSDSMRHYHDERGPLLEGSGFIFVDDAVPERNFSRRVNACGQNDSLARLDDDHPAAIIFTSAEDGVPGGAMITHRAIFETGRLSGEMRADESDTTLAALPLFHAFGLTTTLFLPLYNRSMVRLVERFSIRKVAELLSDGQITVFCGVPVMFGALAKMMDDNDGLARVRVWVSGGEAVSPELQRGMKSRFGMEIRQGYGLTEASPIVTWNSLDVENRHGSVGKAMPYNSVRLMRNGREAANGEEGEVYVKGVNVVPGYYSDPEKTRAAISGGWLRTGDIALRDSDGYYFIRGRIKNMVLKNGFNVYPREVERILSLHPGVDRVEVSGRINLRDDYSGKDALDAVVYGKKGTALDEKSFRDWCAENISSYKIPDMIRIM